jgi:Protein of unknwon function (DUF3310).
VGYKGYYKDSESTSPEHYSRYAIEPIDFISLNNIGFEAGNVIKYITRYDAKNGLEDLQKARKYLDFLIAKEEGRNPSSVND